MKTVIILFLVSLFLIEELRAQSFVPNYSESEVPNYPIPNLLISNDGAKVDSQEIWETVRRSEIINLYERYVYGKAPEKPLVLSFQVNSINNLALNGKAIRKEVTITIQNNKKVIDFNLLIYLPNGGRKQYPVFVGLNFYGNQTIHNDDEISLSEKWMKNNESFGIINNRATEVSRGARSNRWPIEYILESGYGLVTLYYGDIDPDYDDGFQNGIHPLFYKEGQIKPADDEWASISAWSWGLSRVVDYLVTDEMIDKGKIILMGHSRLGKAALWAGALDKRFAIVISNNSGCGGAALFRRRFGETIEKINSDFPHWFCSNFKKYNNNEEELPVDQHMMISLMAPRPVYIASAEEDLWADPYGEFLSAKNAGEVYKLYGLKGIAEEEIADCNKPIMNSIGYHVRSGKHDVTKFDWENFIDFADKHFGKF